MTHQTIENNQYDHELTLFAYHSAYDKDHLADLVKSMQAFGWVGAPLVKYDEQLMTGSHRYEAACIVGLDTIPVVDYKDIFSTEYTDDELDDIVADEHSWVVDLTQIAHKSDPEIAAELGLDAH